MDVPHATPTQVTFSIVTPQLPLFQSESVDPRIPLREEVTKNPTNGGKPCPVTLIETQGGSSRESVVFAEAAAAAAQ